MLCGPGREFSAMAAPPTKQKAAGKPTASAPAKKGAPKGKKRTQSQPGGPKAAELRKQQQSVQAEVTKTREAIRKNEQEVKQSLNELSRLEGDIATSKRESATLAGEVNKLSGKISTLQGSIDRHKKELERLREEYLKAVKKMRISKKRTSKLAYLFSASDLAQADRRMRYLKEFSEWKDRQTALINSRIEQLKIENKQLQQAKSDKDIMLGRELAAQNKLTEQKQRQDVLIADLKANGDVLQDHLAKKQLEVNALKNQVAAVIAEEQRKAEAERQRKAELARQERERKEREKAALAAKKATEEKARREAAEKEAARKEALRKEQEEKARKEQALKDKARKEQAQKEADQKKKEQAKKDQSKKEVPQKEQAKQDNSGRNEPEKKDYAIARKRKPRNTSPEQTPKKETPKKVEPKKENPPKETPKKSSGFGDMRGALPRPVGGHFRVTGKFGRHSLPDLPNVTYDNPGIDVEVSKGASANCVYAGTVTGVYVVTGFSNVVIVNHGDYYTVYGNIASPHVKVGDNVKQGQAIGKLGADPDNPGYSTLHFEVWKGREKLNPSAWIK